MAMMTYNQSVFILMFLLLASSFFAFSCRNAANLTFNHVFEGIDRVVIVWMLSIETEARVSGLVNSFIISKSSFGRTQIECKFLPIFSSIEIRDGG